jgi:2-oxoglutarate ferredoxin oxidoreductase subunit alpha
MQGNEAVSWGAIAAGCRFFGGYPITPSTEIAEMLSRELPKVGGKFIQMEDEIASLAACIGASVGGLKSMTATPARVFHDAGTHWVCCHDRVCLWWSNVQRLGPSMGSPPAPRRET